MKKMYASRRSPWTARAYEVLERGPINREGLIAAMAKAIPPERAARHYEFIASLTHIKCPAIDGEKVRIGKRGIAIKTIGNMRSRGFVIERDGMIELVCDG